MRSRRLAVILGLGLAGVTTPIHAQASRDTLVRPEVLSRHPLQNPHLTESSGVQVSRTQPGVLWTFNDSGNPPELFATDTGGRDLGVFTHPAFQNHDWESLSTVPCGESSCLYVGDTGDNREVRNEIQIYRWPEPRLGDPSPAIAPARLRVRYADRPHDTEAIFAQPDGTLNLVTKGRSGGIMLFRVPASAWTGADSMVTATLVQRLPIPAEEGITQQVTDAALAPDGSAVVIRTYRYLYFFTLGADGGLLADPTRPTCDIGGLEPQGEGVDWLDDHRLVLTSEQVAGMGRSVIVVSCPVR